MPAIWNVNKGYDVNNKKLSSKLTFEVGEKFSGKIVDKAEGNEVLVKLSDGWQFTAEVEGEYNVESQGLVKFAVEGFDNGKLKLKVVKDEQKAGNLPLDSLTSIMEKEGLSTEDMDLLKAMTKHNIPLTRDNISYIKSVLQFSENINQNPQEIDDFVDKFIVGKGIDMQSTEAKELQNVLRDFLTSFKNLSHQDILLFLENNIELNKENIESYDKLFKSNNNLKEYFDSIGKELINIKENLRGIQNINESNVQKFNIQGDVEPKNIQSKVSSNNIINSTNNKVSINDSQIATKAYDSNDTVKGKISIISLLKSMMNTETSLIKEPLKNILAGRANMFNFSEYNSAISKLDNLSDNAVLDMLKEHSVNQRDITKDTLNKVVSNIFNKEIDLSDTEFEKTTNMVRIILEDNVQEGVSEGKNTKNAFESSIKSVGNVNSSEAEIAVKENGKLKNLSGNDTKKMQFQGNEIEQNQPEGKPILNVDPNSEEGNSNSKSEGIKSQKQSVINQEGVVREQGILKSDGEKAILKEAVNGNPIIKGLEGDDNLKNLLDRVERLASKDLIKNDIKVKLEDMKDVIKELIKITDGDEFQNSKIMELIKGNINDFKLLNSISNEYYYLDIPIKNNDTEYPCKLIIKDNRKDGKKIDRSNIKMVVSVQTINLGNVDGYLKVRDLNLDIDIKCEDRYMKIINMGKEKLNEGLNGLGFFVKITVTKKEEEVGLTTCRDFFNDSNTKAIDIKV